MLEFIIMGMVIDKALTGYDIKKYIEDGIGVFYKASYGSLYPSLRKLTQKDYLTMFEQAQGGRVKKYYKVTKEGENVFFKWLSASMDLNENTDNHLAKVYFFDRLPNEIRNQQLQEYEINNLNYLRKLQELEKHFSQMENKDCFYYKLSTLYYGISIIKDNIRWCQHIRGRKPLSEFIRKEEEK